MVARAMFGFIVSDQMSCRAHVTSYLSCCALQLLPTNLPKVSVLEKPMVSLVVHSQAAGGALEPEPSNCVS